MGFVFGSRLYTTEAAMFKRVLDCTLPDPDPSAACVEMEDEDYAAPNGDDSFHD